MKQSQESTTETKSQRHRRFRRESKSRIVKLQLLQRSTQILKILSFNRIHTSKDHRLGLFKSCNSLFTRTRHVGNCITYLYLGRSFDTRNNISHITRRDSFGRLHTQFKHTYLVRIILFACIEETYTVVCIHGTIYHFEISNNTTERIEYRVKHQTLQRRLWITNRRSNTLNDSI